MSRRRPTRLQARPTAEWIPLPVPPIIDAELFRRSQAIHHDNSRFSPRHLKSGHYLLRRVVRCRVCDLGMSCHRMRGRNGTFHHYLLHGSRRAVRAQSRRPLPPTESAGGRAGMNSSGARSAATSKTRP